MPVGQIETAASIPAPWEAGTEEQLEALGTLTRPMLFGTYFSQQDDTGTTVVSFSFPAGGSRFPGYSGNDAPFVGLKALTADQQDIFRATLDMVEGVANIQFTEVVDSGNQAGTIRVAWTAADNPWGSAGSVGWSYFPHEGTKAGDIWLRSSTLSPNSSGFTMLHELGHALGLKHPFDTLSANPYTLPSQYDNYDYTVMSYTPSNVFKGTTLMDLAPQSFMWLDILGLQALYGANLEHENGDTVYDFNNGRHFLTLWDTGGNDTIDVSEVTANIVMDLTPGSWIGVGTTVTYFGSGNRFLGTKTQTVFVPPTVTLENVKSGTGDDRVTGNGAGNRLSGGAGNDTISGGNGDDYLRGDDGNDIVSGGEGDDTLWAGHDDTGNDVYWGGRGADLMGSGAGNDLIIGDEGSDTLFGGTGDDTLLGGTWVDANFNGTFEANETVVTEVDPGTLWAGAGDDDIYGTNGAEVIGGGTGNDFILAYGGNDLIFGGRQDGQDTIDAGAGSDTVFGGAGDDNLTGGPGSDLIFNGQGDDAVSGGDGNDTLWGGPGNDNLEGGKGADVFAFAGSNGSDSILDFDPDMDQLLIESDAISSLEDLKAYSTQVGSNVVIAFGETIITLFGIELADLTQSNTGF